MKNLKKWRKREIGYTVLCVILLFMPIVLLTLLNTLFSGLLNQNNTTMVAIICMMVFWGVVLFLLKKHTHNMLIVDAMVKNEKRLRSDRRFYPSNRRDVTKDFLYGILAAEGFVLGEKNPCLAVKGNTGVWISDENTDFKQFLLERKAETDAETGYRRKNRLSYCVCFLCDSLGKEEEDLSRDVVELESGCIVPVFYDKRKNVACYMGGYTGRSSDEAPIQKVIRNIILDHPEPFAEKTEEDKTEEEKEFDQLDLDEIFGQVDEAAAKDRARIENMEDGEISLDFEGNRGTIFYKKDGKGLFLSVSRAQTDEKLLTLDSLENLYFCFPRVSPVKGRRIYEFKAAAETFLTDNGYRFIYKGEKK